MKKDYAIKLLGGTQKSAAEAVGISQQAVHNWPATLPPRIADRVIVALFRAQTSKRGLIRAIEAALATMRG